MPEPPAVTICRAEQVIGFKGKPAVAFAKLDNDGRQGGQRWPTEKRMPETTLNTPFKRTKRSEHC